MFSTMRYLCLRPLKSRALLDRFARLPYKSCASVLLGKPVQRRRGPATVSSEGRSDQATGAYCAGKAASIRRPASQETDRGHLDSN